MKRSQTAKTKKKVAKKKATAKTKKKVAKKKATAKKKKKKTKKASKKGTRRMQQETNLSKKESSELSADLAEWGDTEVSSKDILIPRILCMQGLSDAVTEGKAKLGDLFENMNETVLGGIDSPIEFIPFKLERVWKIMDGKACVGIVPVVSNPERPDYNENLSFEDVIEVDGKNTPIKRYRAMRFYALLPSELEEGGAIPYMLEFKSTSHKAGQKLATQMYTKNKMAGLSPASKTFFLHVRKESNDKGTYGVMDVKVGELSSQSHVVAALDWFKMLNTSDVEIKEEEE